jgi:hypothetical protein
VEGQESEIIVGGKIKSSRHHALKCFLFQMIAVLIYEGQPAPLPLLLSRAWRMEAGT